MQIVVNVENLRKKYDGSQQYLNDVSKKVPLYDSSMVTLREDLNNLSKVISSLNLISQVSNEMIFNDINELRYYLNVTLTNLRTTWEEIMKDVK